MPRNTANIDNLVFEDVVNLISDFPLFKDVSFDKNLYQLQFSQLLELDEGEILLDPSTPNSQLYFLIDGKLSVHIELHLKPVATIRKGDCIGEMSLFEGEHPSAYVVAIGKTKVLGIHKEVIWQLIDSSDSFARNLLHLLLNRIWSGNKALVEVEEKLQIQEVSTFLDPLTGIYNRRWLNNMFGRMIDRINYSKSSRETFSLLMIDIDHFKEFNDSNGHLAGDQCLRIVSSVLRSNLRPTDLLARYGGEEFSVLLNNTDLLDSVNAAERLRLAVANQEIEDRHGNKLPRVTISVGIAKYQSGETLEDIIDRADQFLYRAKQNGRNCVVCENN